MTSKLLVPPAGLRGAQEPSFWCAPPFVSSAAVEAIELSATTGLIVDPWQEFVLHRALGERDNGLWSAFEVGVEVSRQNGKGGTLEVRELAGLFLFEEELLVHTAHEFATAIEAMRRMETLIDGNADLSRRVKRIIRSHGEEGIELTDGRRLIYRTRTKRGGRGLSGDLVVFDEAMELPETAIGALMPLLSARPNPQLWYAGSAVDKTVHEHGVAFARLRARALAGNDPSLAFFGWEADGDIDNFDEELLDDPEAWADANPGLGIRITPEYIGNERRSMSARTFLVERLGIGDWPDPEPVEDQGVLDRAKWSDCEDLDSEVLDPVCFIWDVKPDRSAAAIVAAGSRSDGRLHVEVVDHRPGTGWVPARLKQLQDDWKPAAIGCDERSPAAALIARVEDEGVKVTTYGTRDYADACGAFVDLVENEDLRHLGTAELEGAIRGAKKRALGDAWAWSRKNSKVDISPLVAATLAAWAHQAAPEEDTVDVSAYKHFAR